MKEFIVFSGKVANTLVENGLEMLMSRIDYKNPKFKVYIFEDTPRLHEILSNIPKGD